MQLLPKLATVVAALSICTSAALAAEGWGTDHKKATEQAKSEKKLLVMDFTGSDWCGWCKKLDREVFSTEKFKDYAKSNLVLLEVDFPQQKHQSNSVKQQNAKLQKEYKIHGFPTIIVLNGEGKKVGELGYQPGGPDAFIAQLDALKGK